MVNPAGRSATDKKAENERRIFEAFVQEANLEVVPGSIESRSPPEPDIFCVVRGDAAYFEIVELAEAQLRAVSARTRQPIDVDYIRVADSAEDIIRKKLSRQYQGSHPIDLLIYAWGTARPPDALLEDAKCAVGTRRGPFRDIWFYGENGAHQI